MYPSETAACHSAPYDPFWTFFNPIRLRNLALLRTPNNIIFWIGQLKQIFGTFVRKKKIPFFRNERLLYCLANFSRAARCLAVSRGFLYLWSQRSPTLAFHKPPDGVFSPNMAFNLLANFCESCLVEFLLLYLALFRILLAASLRIFGLPLLFLSSNPSFLDDHFTTQPSDFFSFLEISLTDKPVDLSIDAWALK